MVILHADRLWCGFDSDLRAESRTRSWAKEVEKKYDRTAEKEES